MFWRCGKKDSLSKWRAEKLTESSQNDRNPSRGWYRLYPFALTEPLEEAALRAVCCEEESLAMVQIDLGWYRDSELDQAALEYLRVILEFFHREKKELILRFLYDKEGRGMEHEPSGIQTIQRHMRQVGPILQEYHAMIFVLQGLFVGSWGEMHHSKFLTKTHLRSLFQTLWEATAGSCRIAVRQPRYLRMLCPQSEIMHQRTLALYNDGMMASESDFGTYGTASAADAAWEEAFCRSDELAFQHRICRTVPNGGEVVQDNQLNDLEHAIATMRQMHITYLHSLYDLQVLEKWKNSSYQQSDAFQGKSGYDYIGAHLGYRFVVRKVILQRKQQPVRLQIAVENTGFANAYEEMHAFALLRFKGKTLQKIPISTDVRTWNSGETSQIFVEIGAFDAPEAEVWLQIERVKDGRCIQMANNGAGQALFLGCLLHRKRA